MTSGDGIGLCFKSEVKGLQGCRAAGFGVSQLLVITHTCSSFVKARCTRDHDNLESRFEVQISGLQLLRTPQPASGFRLR